MIDAVMYMYYCSQVGIPLTHTERTIFEDMTDGYGWIDEEAYIRKMSGTPFLTNHQIDILRGMPHRWDTKDEWHDKTHVLETEILPRIHKINYRAL